MIKKRVQPNIIHSKPLNYIIMILSISTRARKKLGWTQIYYWTQMFVWIRTQNQVYVYNSNYTKDQYVKYPNSKADNFSTSNKKIAGN